MDVQSQVFKEVRPANGNVLVWEGCYDKALTGFLVPEAFVHPAKFSLALVERIYQHMIKRGWLKKGDLVGDPFGGVATGGIVAAYYGLRWIGCELEPKFVTLAELNIKRHEANLNTLGLCPPIIFRGDSRRFAHHVESIVSSPPYAQSLRGLNHNGIDPAKMDPTKHHTGKSSHVNTKSSYGASPGQIEKCREGSIDSVLSSPPYADIRAGSGGLNHKPAKKPGQQTGRSNDNPSLVGDPKYGRTEGQISQLMGVATSPPWESNTEGGVRKGKLKSAPSHGKGHYASPEARAAQLERDEAKNYGDEAGNIGNTRKETYWDAMFLVYAQCFQCLKPGGVAAVVVKDYVKNRQIVPLCDDTARLLEHLGFVVIERARAMLTAKTIERGLFEHEIVTKRERKSFFRRLYEADPKNPKIDWEEVIFARKPL